MPKLPKLPKFENEIFEPAEKIDIGFPMIIFALSMPQFSMAGFWISDFGDFWQFWHFWQWFCPLRSRRPLRLNNFYVPKYQDAVQL
jgi:hypothetical protein